ncbi:3-methyl-2-oxobutanoate hydroxymethyltransferase [Candidatus Halobeggiatoa sp. HSG11]|nr:3-methyl-2-oxobutanoate hydroxymethyltransferase [Candidatus Halobeggiatoa sp. HSG11]
MTKLDKLKQNGEKITCLTAYDASFASIIDQAGIDILLVGDSLGMVIQGQNSTVPVTLDDMIYHCQLVARGKQKALLIADMPFMTYSTQEMAFETAARLMREGQAQMVKLEGAWVAETIEMLVERGIPVCGHLGLTPQSVYKLGGYRVQGRTEEDAQCLKEDALLLQSAGASLIVLECVPGDLAAEITASLQIPTIGIGAGKDCDGQVLVLYDMLGITVGKKPSFSKDFLQESGSISAAIEAFIQAVKNGTFPGPEHIF